MGESGKDFVPQRLPRLMMISDVNAERTGGGGLVLYRLLQDYPPNLLEIVSYPTTGWTTPIDRLPGVNYYNLRYKIPRFIFNRFNPFWPVVMARYITRRVPEVMALAQAFKPEAILSVAHDYLWFVADVVARKLKVPLHLILHDDWPYLQTLAPARWVRPYVQRACGWKAGRVFKRAARLYAVSPGMAERYRTEYGVDCEILYPSRGEDSPAPMVRVQGGKPDPFVVAYAGLIHHDWTIRALKMLAKEIAKLNGRVDLYVPYADEQLIQWDLIGPNLRRIGFFQAREMADRVSKSAQALFLPASFDEADRRHGSTLFPSKLADYTAIGLPILIWGPAYSSAARWAIDNPGAAELVTDPDSSALSGPLVRLGFDNSYARRLAEGSVSCGIRDFDPKSVRAKVYSSLQMNSGASGR